MKTMKKVPDNQPELFSPDPEQEKIKKASDDFHWRQFCRLGEMMGDGLHYEEDGKWIEKEYRQLAKFLVPGFGDIEKKRRKERIEAIDQNMKKLLLEKKCNCGGMIVQSRSGSKVCYCSKCNQRYRAGKPKKK